MRIPILLALLPIALAVGSATALNTSIPGSGLPSAAQYSTVLLPERADVISWKTLAAVEPIKEGSRIVMEFSPQIRALDRKPGKVQGFMIPLDMGERHSHFLVSAVPPSCQFCLPAGPEAVVEVRAKQPVRYTAEPIIVSGRFELAADPASGVFYRMTDAVAADLAPPWKPREIMK